MILVGNILLAICVVIFFALLSAVFGKAPRGGDAVVGYLWGIIFINIAFWICLNLISLIIASKDGFNWVSSVKSTRYFIVFSALFIICMTIALSGLYKYEPGSSLLRFFSGFVPALVPLILILAAAILLNPHLRTLVPPSFIKWPLVVTAGIGLLGVVSVASDFVSHSIKNNTARIQEIKKQEDDNHIRILAEIDSCDVAVNMVAILVFTGDNQPVDIQQRAVAKVKTNAQWQQELIRLLETGWSAEAFQFLASNPVDDPALFYEPVRKGVFQQSLLIRESIQRASHSSHFYQGLFLWEVERVIRTVDRFKGHGTDYLPAMKELRAALDEPSDYKEVTFDCLAPLDKWIRSNQ